MGEGEAGRRRAEFRSKIAGEEEEIAECAGRNFSWREFLRTLHLCGAKTESPKPEFSYHTGLFRQLCLELKQLYEVAARIIKNGLGYRSHFCWRRGKHHAHLF